MKKKNNLFKNIFLMLFAICFLSVGTFALCKDAPRIAMAETGEQVTNDLPDFFVADEYLKTSSSINTETDVEYDGGLIDSNMFLYFVNDTTSNYLKLSFNMGKGNYDSTDDKYKWVYYPDPDNTSLFYFFTIDTISLSINGVDQNITSGNFKKTNGLTFKNYPGAQLDGFEMIFSDTSKTQGERLENEISLLDDNGKLIEGLYTVNVTYILHTCTDGGTTGDEEHFSDSTSIKPITYSFYCTSRDTYFSNDRPNIEKQSFDHEVSVSNLTNPNVAYYLYSNYSSDKENATDTTQANEIPYIDYDYTRYELTISKELAGQTFSEMLSYDISTSTVLSSGDDIVMTTFDDNICRVYFTNVGDYNLMFNAIAIIDYKVDAQTNEIRKYDLTGITNKTKNVLVYVYGYQANYTDHDAPADANNNKPKKELKTFDEENAKIVETADITSLFLNSDNDYSYSQTNYNTTFLISNITNFINNFKNKDSSIGLSAIKTNQTPIEFTGNATLNTDLSYVYSTEKISSAYSLTNYKLGDKYLYRTNFTGKAESANGTYIYVMAYTYKNYFSSEATLSADKKFYQVFYFEINKVLPKIDTYTETNGTQTAISVDSFTNQDVIVDVSNVRNAEFNKDVTVQIYAWDYDTKMYMADFGGTNGVSFDTLYKLDAHKIIGADNKQVENKIKLSDGAKYTIRLYFSNEVTSNNIPINSISQDYFRQQTFTIDKTAISQINGRNVEEITNSTDYRIVSDLQTFTTNQNMVLSWSEKNSGAKTYAYYRYFPIIESQYYSANQDTTTRELMISDLLEKLLLNPTKSYLPLNYALNLSTTNNIWLPYQGNTATFGKTVSTEYVFTDAGLYLVEVYDEAGNSSIEVFMIDNTTPIFAINDGSKYSLTSSSMFITTSSTLYWANYKGLYISNMPTDVAFINTTPENVGSTSLSSAFYQDHNGQASVDIYKKLYNKLFTNNYMQYLNLGISVTGANVDVTSYNGYYITIPINDVSYYIDDQTENQIYARQDGKFSQQFIINAEDDIDDEMTYSVLIRDLSNTKLIEDYKSYDVEQYTNHYSAKQTIIISTDDSEFFIKYENDKKEMIPLTSNFAVYGETILNDTPQTTKTFYLSPTNMKEAFVLTFVPTVYDDERTIQVDTVQIDYYPYVERSYTIGNITYHYYTIDEANKTPILIYQYGEGGNDASTETITEEIRLNAENITASGKYVITRTYKVDDQHSFNPRDYYQRTYEFYVDRNEVVSNAELVTDTKTDSDGNVVETNSHLESLVGGDIFVSMYDNKTNADLVVTFPDSPLGNANGSSIYNNNSGTARSVLTTNMLPVRVYVPEFKYTTYSKQIEYADETYDFEAKFDTPTNANINNYYANANGTLKIAEYVLFAQIRKDGKLIAQTSTDYNNIASKNGFLTFFDINDLSEEVEYLKDAGSYEVTICQGRFGSETFRQELTFCFEIQKDNPDFYTQSLTGSTLHEDVTTSTYYTNQSNINLIWEAGDDYIAEIDLDKITFKAFDANGIQIDLTPNDANTKELTTNSTLNKNLAYVQAPSLSNGLYIAQISMEKFGIYQHGAKLEVTMQYENHDEEFYDTVTKTIYIDLSAPSTNVQNLVQKSIAGGLINSLTNNALRTYYTAKMGKTTSLENTSFNISATENPFAYYSYTVTSDYLETLKQTIGGEASQIYVRALGTDKYSNAVIETPLADFSTTSPDFENVSDVTFERNNYYEIVELDLAGNMSIYSIYVVDYSEVEQNASESERLQNNLLTYTDSDGKTYSYTIADFNEVNAYGENATHNIYSKTGFELTDINFFGDEWAQIELTTYDLNGYSVTKKLMLSPWDKESAYVFTVSAPPTPIAISDLVDGLTSTRFKNKLKIYNRESGTFEEFYINIRNTTLSATLTNDKNQEYIRFPLPTDTSIQNELYASTYLTSLKITAGGTATTDGTILCDETNKLGYGSIWQQKFANNNEILVTITDGLGITFAINPALGFAENTRITYEYTDNYGKTTTEIHLYKETVISQEVQAEGDLYSYYDTNSGLLYYLTKDGFKYLYNSKKYDVNVFNYDVTSNTIADTLTNATASTEPSDKIEVMTIRTTKNGSIYDDAFVIEVTDKLGNSGVVKRIYFKLYNQLPTTNLSTNTLGAGQFRILDTNGTNITDNIINETLGEEGYYSEVRIQYRNIDSPFIPIKYSISTDKQNWQEITSGTFLRCETEEMQKYYLKVWYQEDYLQNETGSTRYVFGYVPESQIFEFNLSSLTATFWIEKTINGVTEVLEKSDTIYKTPDGKQYSNHYIVNLSYSQRKAITIKTNKEQDIFILGANGVLDTPLQTFEDSIKVQVYSELYHLTNRKADGSLASNIPPFDVYLVITYIPYSENFVEEFYTYNLNGNIETNQNLIGMTSKSLVVPETNSLNTIELQWTKYYGISQNEISISLVKDGIEMTPTVYTRKLDGKLYNYVYLKHSGKYLIKLYDTSGNVQVFNKGSTGQTQTFTLIFLKDVPFTVTYTDVETGEEVTTLPIKEAVYNGAVTLNIDKNTRSEFYSLSGYPIISVKKNGVEYTKEFQDDTTYIFNESGYYEVSFLAVSNDASIGNIRQETYQFTIQNPNEYRYSYIFNKYSNYYVERIVKDGIDVTDELTQILSVSKILINGKPRLTSLPLSSLDEKTGAGKYLITINANDSSFKNSLRFSYYVTIQTSKAPIQVSLAEGKETTKSITISFNQTNIYREMGECTLKIVRYDGEQYLGTYYTLAINDQTNGEKTTSITTSGTYYIQVVSPSNNLLYSYKVTKNEPLNAAAIIAIVISAVVLIAVIFIIVKLRKRISVK